MCGELISFFIAIEQVLNVMFGSGWADETLSAYSYRTKNSSELFIDILFWFDDFHCKESYEYELKRRQLPPENRS